MHRWLVLALVACGCSSTADAPPEGQGPQDAAREDVSSVDAPLDSTLGDVPSSTDALLDGAKKTDAIADDGPPIAVNPCTDAAGKARPDGGYCGGPIGGAKDTLYQCAKGAVSGRTVCAEGCQVEPSGTPDRCIASRSLFVAWDTSTSSCRGVVEDFFACLYGATNVNDMQQAYPAGARLHFAGDAIISGCGATDYQCVVDAAKFAVSEGDVVLHLHPGAAGGSNDWTVTVKSAGKTVGIHGGHAGAGSGCGSQTVYGMHEVYEAAAHWGAADCCDGEVPAGVSPGLPWCGSCAASCGKYITDGSYGIYELKCPSGAFRAQQISPTSDEWSPAGCSTLKVDATSLCAQPRAVRDAPHCVSGNLVTCSLGPKVVKDCAGLGCSDTPSAHCN